VLEPATLEHCAVIGNRRDHGTGAGYDDDPRCSGERTSVRDHSVVDHLPGADQCGSLEEGADPAVHGIYLVPGHSRRQGDRILNREATASHRCGDSGANVLGCTVVVSGRSTRSDMPSQQHPIEVETANPGLRPARIHRNDVSR
jgi:hypothetical protein